MRIIEDITESMLDHDTTCMHSALVIRYSAMTAVHGDQQSNSPRIGTNALKKYQVYRLSKADVASVITAGKGAVGEMNWAEDSRTAFHALTPQKHCYCCL